MAKVELMKDYSGYERGGGNAAERLAAQVQTLRDAGLFQEPVEQVANVEPFNWADYFNPQINAPTSVVPEKGEFGVEDRGAGIVRLLSKSPLYVSQADYAGHSVPAADK